MTHTYTRARAEDSPGKSTAANSRATLARVQRHRGSYRAPKGDADQQMYLRTTREYTRGMEAARKQQTKLVTTHNKQNY